MGYFNNGTSRKSIQLKGMDACYCHHVCYYQRNFKNLQLTNYKTTAMR